MKLDTTPSLYVFALNCTEETAQTIREEAAALAGRSQHRRDLCLGIERLSTSLLTGKARAYAGAYAKHINEARALLDAAAAKRGCVIIDCVAADRCKHWGIIKCQD